MTTRTRPTTAPKGFRPLLAATAVSTTGDGAVEVAFALLAYGLSGSALAPTVVFAAGRLPWLVAAVPLGAVVDRREPVRMLVLSNVCAALVLAVTAAVLVAGVRGAGVVAVLAVATAAVSLAQTAYQSAVQTVLPATVAPDRLMAANGIVGAAENSGETLVGPLVGAVLVAGATWLPALADAGTFVLAAVLLSRIPRAPRTDPDPDDATPPTGYAAEVREGVAHLLRAPLLRGLVLAVAVVGFAQLAVIALTVVLARGTLHVPADEYGLFLLPLAVAATIAGFASSRLPSHSPVRVLAWAILACAVGIGLLSVSRTPVEAALCLAVEGFAATTGVAAYSTARQTLIPAALAGRVSAAARALVGGAGMLGSLAGGAATVAFGVRPVLAAAAVLTLASALMLARLPRETGTAVEHSPARADTVRA